MIQFKVELDPTCSYVVIPAAFSPNNDGKNDFFHALSKGVVSFDLKLYNRWGATALLLSKCGFIMGWKIEWNGSACGSLHLGIESKIG